MFKIKLLKSKRRFIYPGIVIKLLFTASIILSFGYSLDAKPLTKPLMQAITITGNVTDANTGEPVPGANIVEKGTTNGTISDVNGHYQLTVSGADVNLVFSFVGYLTQEIPVGGNTQINVALKTDARSLDEVVVIGYGTQRAKDLTGAISMVSVSDMKKTEFPSILRALQGQAPGVLVTQLSGDPGAEMSVKIRGIGSINRSSEPLYIIDGVPASGMNGISPEDIESMQILKDASSTAIYGARGANGVVIITTKRGKKNGGLKTQFSTYAKFSDFPKYRRYDIMNADEYVALTHEAYILTDPTKEPAIIASDSLRQAYGNTDTNWQDQLLRTGHGQNYYLGISGGNEHGNFSVSGNYYSEEGVMINTNFERLNLRANSDFSLWKDRLTIGESFLISRTRGHGSQGGQGNKWVTATYSSPLMPVYEPKNVGGFAGPTDSINGTNETTNPVAEQMLRNQDNQNLQAITDMYAELQIVKGLKYKLNLGLTYGNTRNSIWIPLYVLGDIGNRSNSVSEDRETSNDNKQWLIENLLTYTHSFGDHNFSLLAGQSRQYNNGNSFTAIGQNFRDPNHHTLSQAETASSLGSYEYETILDSYLGRLLYDYKGKYLLTASIRRDGSSRFGPEGQRYGNFPSFSVGWKLNEDFFRDVKQINLLKIRIGWGITGNQNIGDYAFDTYLLRPDASRYLFGTDETVYLGATDLRSTGNPRIQWEQCKMTNFGFDFSGFNNRLEINADYYIKNQDQMLTTIELPLMYGKDFDDPASNPWYNLGDVQNRGFEFGLMTRNNIGKFNYSFGVNLTTIKNIVKHLPNSTPIYTSYTITKEGHAIGSFYGFVADGIFQSQDEIDNHAEQTDAQPGDIRFRDLNNDGVINALDETIIGKPIPDFTYGININLGYSEFDINLFLNGMQNLDVYNEHYSYIGLATDRNSKDFNKLSSIASGYWSDTNPTNSETRLATNDPNQNSRHSTWFVENASFLRIQSVQLGYNLPEQITNRLNISHARIYLNGQNLHVFTKYRGYDPEIGNTDVLNMGIDAGFYPAPRSFLFGIQLDF